MGIKLFLNEYYDLLKFMHDNEVVILDEKVIPLTQHEIATTLKCSKMKINSMFSILQKQDYIEQKTRGKYVLTDKAEKTLVFRVFFRVAFERNSEENSKSKEVIC